MHIIKVWKATSSKISTTRKISHSWFNRCWGRCIDDSATWLTNTWTTFPTWTRRSMNSNPVSKESCVGSKEARIRGRSTHRQLWLCKLGNSYDFDVIWSFVKIMKKALEQNSAPFVQKALFGYFFVTPSSTRFQGPFWKPQTPKFKSRQGLPLGCRICYPFFLIFSSQDRHYPI